MMETLAHWQVLLWDLFRHTLALIVLASHGVWLDLLRGGRNRYMVCEVEKRKEQRQLQV